MEEGWLGKNRGDFDLLREIFAQSETGAADATEEIPTVGQFADGKGLAKAEIAKLFAAGTLKDLDLKVATDLRLRQALQAVDFEISDKVVYHFSELVVIETLLQQEIGVCPDFIAEKFLESKTERSRGRGRVSQ